MVNRNKRFYKKERVRIDNILEIRLDCKTWERISQIAVFKGKSFSWVVRFAVFRFIKRKDVVTFIRTPTRWAKYQSLSDLAKKQASARAIHRHKLCLYGNDEFLIRMTAAMLCCTMTHLVRLSLEWNLGELERSAVLPGRFHRLVWYWMGIKLFRDVKLPIMSHTDKHLALIRFDEDDYW